MKDFNNMNDYIEANIKKKSLIINFYSGALIRILNSKQLATSN